MIRGGGLAVLGRRNENQFLRKIGQPGETVVYRLEVGRLER